MSSLSERYSFRRMSISEQWSYAPRKLFLDYMPQVIAVAIVALVFPLLSIFSWSEGAGSAAAIIVAYAYYIYKNGAAKMMASNNMPRYILEKAFEKTNCAQRSEGRYYIKGTFFSNLIYGDIFLEEVESGLQVVGPYAKIKEITKEIDGFEKDEGAECDG